MKLKERIKSKSFWAGLVGAVFLILGAFGVDVGDEIASSVVNAVCSLFVVLGIVSSQPSNGNCRMAEEDDEKSDITANAVSSDNE
ncbi:MAG: hypothetical protein J1G01_00135 [Clostridiales bacterium]|nr:hypothetical protein [Clostridiales bacterium]